LSTSERRSLAGTLSYAVSIEPDLLNRLIIKFGSAVVRQALVPPPQEVIAAGTEAQESTDG
jgi:hypothetical protein